MTTDELINKLNEIEGIAACLLKEIFVEVRLGSTDGAPLAIVLVYETFTLDTWKMNWEDLPEEIKKEAFKLMVRYASTPLDERDK